MNTTEDWAPFGSTAGVDALDEPGRFPHDLILGLCDPHEDDVYLDVGTGLGPLIRLVGSHTGTAVGVDVAQPMLGLVRARCRTAYPVAAHAAGLPFVGGSFTLVTCAGVLHHCPDPEAVLGEIAEMLIPGGRLLLIEPAGPEQPVLMAVRNEVERARDPSHRRLLSPAAAHELLERSGFIIKADERQLEDMTDVDWAATAGSDIEPLRAAIHRRRRMAAGFRALKWEDGAFVFRRERAYYLAVRQ